MVAQGKALGVERANKIEALKGRANGGATSAPLQG